MPPELTTELLVRPLSPGAIPLDLKKIYLLWILLAVSGICVPIIAVTDLHALLLILLFTGCILLAALFPARDDLGGTERAALSIATVPIIGLALNYMPWGIRSGPTILPLMIAGILAGFIVQYHRNGVPTDTFPVAIKEFSGSSASRMEQVLSIILIAAVLVAAGTTIFIILAPAEGEKFTEFYILGPKGKAADYPTEFMAGTPQTVIIGIGNHEGQDITYTVQTFAVQSRFDNATNQSVIVSAVLLDQFSVTVPHNQTVEQPYTFRIMDSNTNRIEFLLFKEVPPENRSGSDLIDASYRDLHLWLRVH
ncbi:MAG TPA: DUF1616 domain-containing protein [Candidatus Methanoculleus thermohydrogenotrophicum]|nr:DUF1616 domain-containing protein [Candidatus Methanoculleus thermohydrogenotrophicum]NLM83013.1 DUF1616 domain-containing protein [Candidatus Methanoculleus thermohydrogenotrophicum]HOB17608.1 DUF1616 domain-containing protein [Candidatus Methanoculleus thermohydrogenotrophicum]HPZ38285.1 DUF1616 domain-containing protein [Candidatus Methanoculleus thermohydrogenotrophicum]